MGSGYSSEEELETQVLTKQKNIPINLQEKHTSRSGAEEELDVVVNDFGGREQGDGMEKEEEQPVQTFEDHHSKKEPAQAFEDQKQLQSQSPPLETQETEEEEPPLPSLCQNELLNSGTASSPRMESANIIRKPAGLLLPEAGGLVISKLPPIHDNVDLRPTPLVCFNFPQTSQPVFLRNLVKGLCQLRRPRCFQKAPFHLQ